MADPMVASNAANSAPQAEKKNDKPEPVATMVPTSDLDQ